MNKFGKLIFALLIVGGLFISSAQAQDIDDGNSCPCYTVEEVNMDVAGPIANKGCSFDLFTVEVVGRNAYVAQCDSCQFGTDKCFCEILNEFGVQTEKKDSLTKDQFEVCKKIIFGAIPITAKNPQDIQCGLITND